jgi:DNA-directed RNA polymerase subunit M/transcription elongation factor TFIIS
MSAATEEPNGRAAREPLAPIETAARAAWLALLYVHAREGGAQHAGALAAARAAEAAAYGQRCRYDEAPLPTWRYDAAGRALYETDGPDAHARAAAEAYGRALHRIAAVLRAGLLPPSSRSLDSWRGGSWVAAALDEGATAAAPGTAHAAWLAAHTETTEAITRALGGVALQGAVVDVTPAAPDAGAPNAGAPSAASSDTGRDDAAIYVCRCGSKNLQIHQWQRRSLDEPADVRLACLACGAKWTLHG